MITHKGGCHCGRVRFEVNAPASLAVVEFKLLAGSEVLTEYKFNTGTARHLFCSVCGVKSFYVPRSHPDGYSVNARCLDEGTVRAMTIVPKDGKNWEKTFSA